MTAAAPLGRVITVFGTKGGTGRTAVAANLGVSLAKSGVTALLLDGDALAAGDLAKVLGLTPKQSLADAAALWQSAEPPTDAQMTQGLAKHASGARFLPLVSDPTQATQLTPALIRQAIAALRARFDFLIVDAGRGFTPMMLALLDETNLLMWVATPDIITLTQVKTTIELLAQLHYPRKLVKMVLNRASSRGAVATADVQGVVPCEVIGHIPSDGHAMGLAINQGIPVVVGAPNTKVAQALQQLAYACRSRPDLYLEPMTDPHVLAERHAQRAALADAATTAPAPTATAPANGREAPPVNPDDTWTAIKRRIHDNLVEKLNLRKLDSVSLGNDPEQARELRAKTERLIADLLAAATGSFLSSADERARLVKELADEALGFGPLEDLLDDPTISDILVNRRDQIYIERRGKLELTNKKFTSDDQLRTVIERIVAPLGRRIDEASPMVDARLPDGSRVNAIIPPLALKGPTVSIRKFSRERFTAEDLVRFGSITAEIIRFLEVCVRARKNIIISGGTGSGKTTFLNIVSSFIPSEERIITIEDAAELRLDQEHLVSLESRPPNVEGRGQVSIRDLFRNALRMRPDRIVIGECRGGETLDMLQAMNTGHDGSLTTVHANSPRDVISRLDSLVLMSNIDLPVRAIREQIVSAVDLIVHTARLSDGSRRVTAVSEIIGLKDDLEVELRDLFVFHQTGIDKETGKVQGAIVPTGNNPTFLNELHARGLDVSDAIFRAPANRLASQPLSVMGSPEFDM